MNLKKKSRPFKGNIINLPRESLLFLSSKSGTSCSKKPKVPPNSTSNSNTKSPNDKLSSRTSPIKTLPTTQTPGLSAKCPLNPDKNPPISKSNPNPQPPLPSPNPNRNMQTSSTRNQTQVAQTTWWSGTCLTQTVFHSLRKAQSTIQFKRRRKESSRMTRSRIRMELSGKIWLLRRI